MDGIELMATAMRAARERLDVSAANLANVSSDGFTKRVARARLTTQGLVTSRSVDRTQGPLRHTGLPFDLAVAGEGGFLVRDGSGAIVSCRSASFSRGANGWWIDASGRVLLGSHGPMRASADAAIDERGLVRESGAIVDRLRLAPATTLQSGFIEASNVDAVHEMVDVLEAQRAFETAEKTLSAIDDTRSKNVNDVARVKS